MKLTNEYGSINISPEVFKNLSGYVATNCFGVKGMASRNVQDGLVHLLKVESLSKGVKVSYKEEDKKITIELHIVIEHGVNIPAISSSIMSEVRYTIEKITGVIVDSVNVCIDSIMVGC